MHPQLLPHEEKSFSRVPEEQEEGPGGCHGEKGGHGTVALVGVRARKGLPLKRLKQKTTCRTHS